MGFGAARFRGLAPHTKAVTDCSRFGLVWRGRELNFYESTGFGRAETGGLQFFWFSKTWWGEGVCRANINTYIYIYVHTLFAYLSIRPRMQTPDASLKHPTRQVDRTGFSCARRLGEVMAGLTTLPLRP